MASDGRRGTLTGKGKTRKLSTTDAAAAATGQTNATAHQGAPNNQVKSGDGGYDASKQSHGQSNGQAAGSAEVEYKKGVPNEKFTEEEDRMLMRMKADDAQWGDILKFMNGKSKKDCSQRFNQIRPDDFFEKKKNEGKGDGKGGNKGDQKNQKQNNQAQEKKEEKKEEKEEEKKEEKKEEKTEEAWVGGGWGDMGGLGDLGGLLGGADDKKSEASNNPEKDEKGGTGTVEPGGWGGTADWTATPEIDNNNKGAKAPAWDSNDGGGGWPRVSDDTNTGGDTNWTSWPGIGGNVGDASGGKTGGAEDSKDGNKDRKGEENKSKKEKTHENLGKGNDKSNTKESEPNASTDSWGAKDGGKDSGGSGTTAGPSGWDATVGDGGAVPAWDDNKNDKIGGGAAVGWGDSKADKDGATEFAGWGGAAASEKDKSSKANSKKNDDGPAPEPWAAWAAPPSPQKPTSKASSKDRKKHRSSSRHSDSKEGKHRSHRHHSSSHPAEYKVAPDSTFSQDELKLIARILQQDCSMVWERVSWRFRDKTGRNLHPDVFEKKITGRLEKERD
jgi:hypothetical protein